MCKTWKSVCITFVEPIVEPIQYFYLLALAIRKKWHVV